MLSLKIFLTKLWIKIFCPIWSFLINSFYYIRYFNKRNGIKETKKYMISLPLKTLMNQFKWKEDSFKDWIPTVYTLICKELSDDCDGAASLAKFWYKENGINSRLVFIYSNDLKNGHTICIRNDNIEFVSNNNIITIQEPNLWKEEILKSFDNKYSIILFE